MKNRCSRCHARLDSHRKTCPYCGTMVRKPRGKVRMAASANPGGLGEMISNIQLPALTGKHLLALGMAAVVIVVVLTMLGCGSCSSCAACSSCGSCTACDSCGSCSSCEGEENGTGAVNGANYNCEYHYGTTLYYVEGDQLIALEDGFETGHVVVGGKGIECVYADGYYVYYIISGKVLRASLNGQSVSDGDVPLGNIFLDPVAVGLEKVNGFALAGEDEMCYWGQTGDGSKVICMTGLSNPQDGRIIYSGIYSNVQCYRGGVYFVSGEEATSGQIMRLDMRSEDVTAVYDQKCNYYTLSGGKVIVNIAHQSTDGTGEARSNLIYLDAESGKELKRFDSFPAIRGIAANDQWIYYVTEDPVTGHTLVYRFSGEGENHQLVFRKAGYYRLYGVAGSYFSLYGDNVYYICNYDQMPNFITIKDHTVLDK